MCYHDDSGGRSISVMASSSEKLKELQLQIQHDARALERDITQSESRINGGEIVALDPEEADSERRGLLRKSKAQQVHYTTHVPVVHVATIHPPGVPRSLQKHRHHHRLHCRRVGAAPAAALWTRPSPGHHAAGTAESTMQGQLHLVSVRTSSRRRTTQPSMQWTTAAALERRPSPTTAGVRRG